MGGDGSEAMEKEGEGEDTPADVPAYGHWVSLANGYDGLTLPRTP